MSERQTLTDIYDKFNFGKHNGQTVRFVIENDPSYILWLDAEKIVKFSTHIIEEANRYDFDDYSSSWGWDGFEGE